MTVVLLYGELGRLFGKRWELAVTSPAEAIRALIANKPEIKKYLIKNNLPGYYVYRGREKIFQEQIPEPSGSQPIKIVPVVAGAGDSKGLFGIILGIALIAFAAPALSFYAGTLAVEGYASAGLFSLLAQGASSIGFSLILGGISQILFKPPKPSGPSERPENKPSFLFDRPVNTTAQGQAVPVGYGRIRTGSAVISAGIVTEEIAAV